MIRLAVFDLDQTLVDTLGRFYCVFSRLLLASTGVFLSWEEFLRLYRENRLGTLVPHSMWRNFWITFLEEYDSCPVEARVIEGADAALAEIKNMGLKVVVATGRKSPVGTVEKELKKLGLLRYVDLVLTAPNHDDPEELFSKANMLKEAMKVFGTEPRETVLVGDYVSDIRSARKVGAFSILVIGNRSPEIFSDTRPDYVVKSIREVVPIIRGLR